MTNSNGENVTAALESIKELTTTLQNYIWEGSVNLEPKHDAVISALVGQIKTECEEALSSTEPEVRARYAG